VHSPEPRVLEALIVDDDEFALDVLQAALEDLAVHVTMARDGAEALALLAAEPTRFDLLFVDLDMRPINGIELLRHLGVRRFTGSIALMSGTSRPLLQTAANMAEAQGLRVVASLPKPLTRTGVLEILSHRRASRLPRLAPRPDTLSEADLHEGLANHRFTIVVQPKVEVATGRVLGGEALLRWTGRDGIPVSPMTVVATAEAAGAMDQLTDAVTDKALDALASWRGEGHDYSIALNVSTTNLRHLEFPDRLAAKCAARGLPASAVWLEITETQMVSDPASTLYVLGRLVLEGFHISVDDFGTGYANHDQLRHLPLHELKIDRSLVTGAAATASGRSIMASAVQLGTAMGFRVTAEGVETAADWQLLKKLRCDVAQGYAIAPGLPLDKWSAWLAEWPEQLRSLGDA
jgi:EAL domain-containing protein (putative c-di-GMP-specific phosphodiesterase class I)/ActR/RegA family two-component response regulator